MARAALRWARSGRRWPCLNALVEASFNAREEICQRNGFFAGKGRRAATMPSVGSRKHHGGLDVTFKELVHSS